MWKIKVRRRLDLHIARVIAAANLPLTWLIFYQGAILRLMFYQGAALHLVTTPGFCHKPSRLLLPNRGVIGTRWAAPAERVRFSWTPLFVDPATQSTGLFSNSADRTAPPPRFLIFWILWIVGVFGFLDFGI